MTNLEIEYTRTNYSEIVLSIECVWPTIPLIQVSVAHPLLVFGLFCKLLIHSPGKLERADADPRFSCIADLVEQNQSPYRFCPYCEVRVMHQLHFSVFSIASDYICRSFSFTHSCFFLTALDTANSATCASRTTTTTAFSSTAVSAGAITASSSSSSCPW